MKTLTTFIRRGLHTIVYALVGLFMIVYLATHFNLVGLTANHAITQILGSKLETKVTIDGKVEVDWRNQVILNNLTIYDQQHDTLIYARRVMLAYDILPLLQHHLVLNTCQLVDFRINGRKQAGDSIPNYQFFIEALKNKNPDKPSLIELVDLNTILLRQGQITYNQYSAKNLSANLHLHGNQLLIKKMHFLCQDAFVKINKLNCDIQQLQYLTKKTKEVKDIFELKGFQIDHPSLNCKAIAKGSTEGIAVEIQKLQLPHGFSQFKGINNVDLRSSIFVSNLSAPLDSIQTDIDIHQATCLTDVLGSMNLSMHLNGMPCNVNIQGKVGTNSGAIKLDGLAISDLKNRDILLSGHCQSSGVELANLLPPSAQIGEIALNTDFSLHYVPSNPIWASIDGTIDKINFKQHNYKDIHIKSEGALDKGLKGHVAFKDSLGDVDLNFDIELGHKQKRYKVDGVIQHLQANALHYTNFALTDSLSVSAKVHADLLAENWKDAEGEVQLTDILLQRDNRHINLEPILFEGTTDRGLLTSQLLQMQYHRNRKKKTYSIIGRVPVLNEIASLLKRTERMSNEANFSFEIDSLQQLKNLTLNLPTVFFNEKSRLSLYAEMEKDSHGTLLPIIDFSASNGTHGLSGTLKGEVEPDPLEITLHPTSLLYNNEKELQLKSGHLTRTEEGSFAIQDFSIEGEDQAVSASGVLGKNGSKDFIVQLEHFDLGQVFRNFNKGYLQFRGNATGDLVFSSEPENILHTEDLFIENFTYIDTLLGDAHLNLDMVLDKKVIDVDCRFLSDNRYRSHAYGEIKLNKHDSLDLHFDTDHLPIGFINYWTGNILQKFSGTLTGHTRLFGDAKRLELAGHPVVDGRFTHSLLDAHFHLNDTIHLVHNLLYLNKVTVDDCNGHPLQLDANVKHDYLSKFEYDVNILMPDANQGFLVLDRKQAPGRIYWGQLYATGQAHLRGGKGQHRINLNVGTTDKSWFYLSPREQSFDQDASSYTFLSFRDKEEKMEEEEQSLYIKPLTYEELNQQTLQKENSPTDLQVDMQINATEKCLVYVQMDPLADDKLECRGHGDLALHYDPRRDITLSGTYNINSGSYSMNMRGDLMNKVFQLENTSTVRFNGVPSEAELALDARYSIPSANLRDLDESITTLGSLSRSSVPVDCKLAVTGQLSSPQVSFDLDVKNVSDEIQAYIHNVIGTQEMLNQEVLYLLLFSKFYTPQYIQTTQTRNGSELTSLASASITSQLNQLLSHMSNNFTMGTNFRSDKGDFSDMEMDLSLSTRLLDDRLLFNGNVGYRDPANHLGMTGKNNSFIGDFDLEFLINPKGTLRVKAYSHYNERDYSINNALTTQGIGFILRKDFKDFQDLFFRRKK